MLSTVLTSRARNISNRTAGVHYESELLRRRSDPQRSCVISAPPHHTYFEDRIWRESQQKLNAELKIEEIKDPLRRRSS